MLTRSAEESYNAGYNQIKAAERAVDIIGFAKGTAKLGKSIGDMSKGPSSVHGESAGGRSAHGDGNSGGRGMVAPRWNDTLHEAVKSLGGDGKFKTNALRLPLDMASLESFMQSLANRMNIFSKRLIPVGFGKISNGRPRWEFEDYSRMDSNGRGGSGGGPDKPPKDHHEDERKRREDEEQQRKDEEAEGTGYAKYDYKKVEEVENRIRHESKEHGQFFDKDGNLIGDTVIGTEKAIDVSDYRDRGKDAVFTHNHPTNGPFSLEDMMVAVDFDMLEMRAITPNGKTFSMTRGIDGWKVDGQSVRMVYRLVQEELRADVSFNKLYKEGRMDEAWDMFYDKVAERIGGEYKRK